MKRFKNILLITNKNDLNSPDIQRAVSLARSNAASLTLADVVLDLPFINRQLKPSHGIESALNGLAEKRLEELKLMARELPPEMNITPLVLQGTPFLEIIRVVMRQKCDLVIKISEPEESFTAKSFGSTDFRLLRKCPCPVWLLKPDTSFSYHSILAAVALETFGEDEDLDSLNQQILEMATSLALKESSELHIVHAWKVFGKDLLDLPFAKYIAGEEVQDWMISQQKDIEERFNHVTELLKKHLKDNNMKSLKPQFHLVEGDAEEVIQAMIKNNKIELVVMGTVARSNLAGLLMGNTAESVLNRISCSVLAVKPSSFTSPVRFDR
jgi:nucleotide-binding universal stress UspA family protein